MKNPFNKGRSIGLILSLLSILSIQVTAQDDQERQLSYFDRVLVSNAITLRVSPGDEQLVRVKATVSDQTKTITEVVNRTLIIRRDNPLGREFKEGAVTVYVTLKNLQGLEANSASKIIGQAPFKAEDFTLTLNQASRASLDLTAQTVTIYMSGASKATLQLDTKELKGSVAQASKLRIKGNPGKQTIQAIQASSLKTDLE